MVITKLSKEERKKNGCQGIKSSGYWKGYHCASVPVIAIDGRCYCRSHIPLDEICNIRKKKKKKK